MALAANESKSVVVLVGVALLAVVGAAYGIFVGLGQPIDGSALLAERFAFVEPPMDLTLARAHRLGNGDRLVELVPREGAEGAALERVVVHFFEEKESPAMSFPDEPEGLDDEAIASWEEKPRGVLRGELQRGRVEFDTWDVMYIRERVRRPEWLKDTEQAFADVLRVNLSNEALPCVLYAYFPRGVDGDAEVLRELLDGLEVK